jgi:hypothetical protein
MAGFFQNLLVVSERESSVDSIGAAYAPTSVNSTVEDTTVSVIPSTIVVQEFPIGFGSYLDGILPPSIARGAGAFAVSMQQIKNVSSIPIEKFAQVVTNLEITSGLNVNGSSVPVDRTLVSQSLPLIALGSGPYGTYTMSDFFGCMSGLPYIGIDIRGLIQAIETPALYNIYENLYLAVTWAQPGTLTATYSNDGFGNYTLTNVTLPANRGGGYGREGTSAPLVTVAGGTATLTIGTDSTDLSTYGKITAVTWSAVGTTGSPTTTVSIPDPTTVYGSSGWSPGMNNAVQYYIDAANAEILAIQTAKQRLSEQMNTNWNLTGTQLTIEQRALNTGLPVPVPPAANVVPDLSQFPTTQIAFTDSVPQFALNTDPHMQAQSIEAIANICSPGGQSIVGMMREARNQARLTEIGVPLDNNISDSIQPVQSKSLVANGSVANSPPATLGQVNCDTGNEITPNPYGFYDPDNNNYYVTNPSYIGTGGTSTNGSAGFPPGAGGIGGGGTGGGGGGGTGGGGAGGGGDGGNGAGRGTGAGSTPAVPTIVDTGNSEAYGSFAGSPYTNLIPTNLNVLYTSKNLLPSTYTITDAIDEVIRCNCDCWDMI